MQYSTIAFIKTLKPKKRSLLRADFVDPISGATDGWIFLRRTQDRGEGR